MAWANLDPSKWVFVEDEGTNVGKAHTHSAHPLCGLLCVDSRCHGQVSTPVGLYRKMRTAPVVLRIVLPMSLRIQVLLEDYTGEEMEAKTEGWQERMEHAVQSLEKRIGRDKCEVRLASLPPRPLSVGGFRCLLQPCLCRRS
jgi:tRNA 2-selenouridine synthase SelU